MRRVLKDTGSIYLHCDPTASHYLKLLMDTIFGVANYRNEITWRRISGGKNDARQYGRNHDTIFFYTRSDAWLFNPPRLKEVNDSWYKKSDKKGRYVSRPLLASGSTGGDSGQPWRDIKPKGHWIVPQLLTARFEREQGKKLRGSVRERLDILADAGYIDFSKQGNPSWRRYLFEANPPRADDMWHDEGVKPISRNAQERLDYPTQKPLALMERIIRASSNEGDTVLDPFCGCGTTVHAADALGRKWLGIDISKFSTGLIRDRILHNFKYLNEDDLDMRGTPESVPEARELARQDPFEFEKWVCGYIGAEGMFREPDERGADGGVDGVLKFFPIREGKKIKPEYAIVQVKGGRVSADNVKALHETVRRYEATAGVMVCFADQLGTVENQRVKATFKDAWGSYPVIQGFSVENLLSDGQLDLPLYGYKRRGAMLGL